MAVYERCENCGTQTAVYRLASVILDGKIAKLCPACVASESSRIDIPHAPRTDQGATQPSTQRKVWY
ncbi:MAG: hypothetical protein ACP5OR_07095 [Candidatus Dormibacteria bacterium]